MSILVWSRVARRDERLLFIYIAALVGAFLGAKVVYPLAEGWVQQTADSPDDDSDRRDGRAAG